MISGSDMKETAEKMIRASKSEASSLFLSVPVLFAAEPYDLCRVELKNTGISGDYAVYETVTWADGISFGTRLYLREVM